jgi:hypothetical protein
MEGEEFEYQIRKSSRRSIQVTTTAEARSASINMFCILIAISYLFVRKYSRAMSVMTECEKKTLRN